MMTWRPAVKMLLAGSLALVLAGASAATAQTPPAPAAPAPRFTPLAPSMPIDLAVEAAKAALASCAGLHMAVTILDQAGGAKLVYRDDGASSTHDVIGLRKANAALLIQAPSEELDRRAAADAKVAAKVAADKGAYVSAAGGLPILAGGAVIGAIGVSGNAPGAKDKSCAVDGLAAVQARLR